MTNKVRDHPDFWLKKKENIASDTEDISRQFKGALH